MQQPEYMRLLVACHDLILSGGMLRFERVARELRGSGHELFFATFSENRNPAWESKFPVLTIKEAMQQEWTATMVPGAGFPVKTIERFTLLRNENFGYRVQHILNDTSQKQRFLAVNKAFNPDLIVFNNRHWVPGSFTDFQARKFAILEGAVDTKRFTPAPDRRPLSGKTKVVIGGLASKNPDPLIEALRQLPDKFVVRLFGPFTASGGGLASKNSGTLIDVLRQLTDKFVARLFGSLTANGSLDGLLSAGRLQLIGKLSEDQLAGFYSEVDIVVHTEEFAGWANLAAEAMASGVPVVCTRHGTASFATHMETALVLDEITGKAIADSVMKLCNDTSHTAAMVKNARNKIRNFDWASYARRLLKLCKDDGQFHYTYAPELGLHGKWPLADRHKDLEYVFEHCEDATVIDFGCADGVDALQCLERGARLVHGIELYESRVNTAARLCVSYPSKQFFFEANLNEWALIKQQESQILLPSYDIVLYLGIQHHLKYPERLVTLSDAASMAGRILAIRTTEKVYLGDDVDGILAAEGFVEVSTGKGPRQDGHGVARIFRRR